MADNTEEEEGAATRGADWEVVSLTASAYAAAPGPKEFDSVGEGDNNGRREQESSSSTSMSEHFVFPPSEHENLPIEPEDSEIHSLSESHNVNPAEEESSEVYSIHEDNLRIKSDDDLHMIQPVDDGSSLSVHGMDPEEGKGIYVSAGHGAFGTTNTESGDTTEPEHPSQQDAGSPPKSRKPDEEDECDESSLPCDAWWKRHAACLYRHAKEANTFWSLCVAAALMGLVILGRRWQREKLQLQQFKWHLNDERLNRILGPIGRFKDALAGGHPRNPLIRGSGAASDR